MGDERRKRFETHVLDGDVGLWRTSSGRWKADFRKWRRYGGDRESLIPEGERYGTKDRKVAKDLALKRAGELDQLKARALAGRPVDGTLGRLIADHLDMEEKDRDRNTKKHRRESARRLEVAKEFFGEDRLVDTISTDDVEHYRNWLYERTVIRRDPTTGEWFEKPVSRGTVRHYLNALSKTMKRAEKKGWTSSNPVRKADKPKIESTLTPWYEVHEAAVILDGCRKWQGKDDHGRKAIPFLYEFVATLFLTGADLKAVRFLRVEDIVFDAEEPYVRFPYETEDRTLKTVQRERDVPLWPQLEKILWAYLAGPWKELPGNRLLFPSPARRTETALSDTFCYRALDEVQRVVKEDHGPEFFRQIARRVGRKAMKIRPKQFRHTYCSARLQTLEPRSNRRTGETSWVPVSKETVGAEMGHGSKSLVDRIYGHVGKNRHRTRVVEYPLENLGMPISFGTLNRDRNDPDVVSIDREVTYAIR